VPGQRRSSKFKDEGCNVTDFWRACAHAQECMCACVSVHFGLSEICFGVCVCGGGYSSEKHKALQHCVLKKCHHQPRMLHKNAIILHKYMYYIYNILFILYITLL
jgi:hypothetical protein